MQEKIIEDITRIFKIFADKTRVKILCVLREGEKCVDEIVKIVDMEQSAISHQLKTLKEGGLIRCRKQGRFVYYFLHDDQVATILDMGRRHADHLKESHHKNS